MLDSVKAEQDVIVAAIRGLDPNRRIDEKVRLMIAKAFPPLSPDRIWHGCWKVINGRLKCTYQWTLRKEAYNLVVSYNASARNDVRFELTKRVVKTW